MAVESSVSETLNSTPTKGCAVATTTTTTPVTTGEKIEEKTEESEIIGNFVDESLSKDVIVLFKKLFNYDIIVPLEVEQKVCQWWDYDPEK